MRATKLFYLALPIALAVAWLAGTPAGAAPATIEMRIEGRQQTLFEGPLSTEGHDVRASSDSQQRPCDGTNAGANPSPGPTATAAGADAMELAGESFDGNWFPGYDDYLITRWGPDRQNAAEGQSWGLLVNRAFSSSGGCRGELGEGDQVLWAYDAFDGDPFLMLSAAGEDTRSLAPIVTAALGASVTLDVESYTSAEGMGGTPAPYDGAEIAPVATAANGFQTIEGASPAAVFSDTSGHATISFDTPGWHRLKAQASGAFRSNRLDVCVPPSGESGCGEAPADDLVRSVQAGAIAGGGSSAAGSPPASGSDPGPKPGAQSPPHAGAQLRFDGQLLQPLDDRSKLLRYSGRWRRVADATALNGTLTVGSRGATLALRLGAGRVVFVLRGVRGLTRVVLSAGGHRRVLTLGAGAGAGARLLAGPLRARAGIVRLRVLKGAAGIDGVALVR